MKKLENNIINLQNLFSWKQFYQQNDDLDSAEKTQIQIDKLQKIIDKKNGSS